MAAAILPSTQYERLAEQCDLRADMTRRLEERAFYRAQAGLFRRLAKMRERREAAVRCALQDNGCGAPE